MNKNKLLPVLISLIIYVACSSLNAQVITKRVIKQQMAVGKPIPELVFESVIQGPEDNQFNNDLLDGKIIILEFWGTWCAPCIKQFPKLNSLTEAFSEENLIIISITDEPEEIVKPFLKRRALKTWVVSDTDKSVINDFGVNAFPTTVVINKNGEVHEYVKVQDLSVEYIKNLLQETKTQPTLSFDMTETQSTQKLYEPKVQLVELNRSTEGEDDSPIYSVSVTIDTSATLEAGLLAKKLGIVDIKGWSLLKIIANVYNTSETLINGDKKLLDTKLNIKVLMPRNQPEMIDILLKEALKKKLNLEVNPIDKELELLALTAPNGLTKYLKEPNQNKGKFSADDGVIAARHWTLASLIRNIELELGESIFDGTKLDKRYDYDLYWNHGDPKSIIKALDEQLGLILKSTIMTMETLEVKQKRTKN